MLPKGESSEIKAKPSKDELFKNEYTNSGHQWTFRVVPNDIQRFSGDCLFMTLAQFLFPEVQPRSSLQFHSTIRESIVNFLIHDEQTWRRYSMWLKNNHQARIKEFRNYLLDSPCKTLHNKIQKAYKKNMLTRGYFGTMAELNAAMELFGFKTTLIQETLPSKQFSVYNIGDTGYDHHFYLLFTGHSDGGHFQKLDLLSEGESIPAGKFQLEQNPGQDHTTMTISRIEQNDCQLPTEPAGIKRMLETEPNQESNKRAKEECINSVHGAEELPAMSSASDEANYSKVESWNLRSSLSVDLFAVTEINTAEDGDSSPDATLPVEAPSSKDSNASYYLVFLPPWSETSLQKALEPMVAEVQEKCFALLDCNNPQDARRSLSLKRDKFVIELEDLYKIKNVTDKGIYIKFRHA